MDRDRFFGTVRKGSLFESAYTTENIPMDCCAIMNVNRLPEAFDLKRAGASHEESVKELYEIVYSY